VTDLLDHVLALALYPGAVAAALLGVAAEIGAAYAFVPERGLSVAARTSLSALRPHSRSVPALAVSALVLALVAAVELAAPFSPVPAAERNALVAASALAGAGWLTWGWGWGRRQLDPSLLLGVQGCWLLAVLLPAVIPETVNPAVLGAQVFPALLPLKIACGALYLACLPPLLQLLPEAAPQGSPGAPGRRSPSTEEAGFTMVRALLWVPYCGLFASLFFPPSADDLPGLLRFLALTIGVAAITVALAGNLARRPPGATQALYLRLALPFAAFAVLVAMLTAILQR
jgi:hypothetical protein